MGLRKRILIAKATGKPLPADAPPEDSTPRRSYIIRRHQESRGRDTGGGSGFFSALIRAAFIRGFQRRPKPWEPGQLRSAGGS